MVASEAAPSGDAAFAGWLAARAGAWLCGLRAERGFADPVGLRAAGDRGAHELLMAELARHRPGDAVLSEEGERYGADRAVASRVWIVDPLDGTREFAEVGRGDWAVHVALWQADADGGRLTAGAVALPGLSPDTVMTSDPAPARPTGRPGPVRLAASRTRPPEFLAPLCARLGGEVVPMGSAGAKIAAVVRGEADAYVHAGGQYEWDSAAPVAVAAAAGLHASRVDGSRLVYNREDPWLPDVLVCRPELADRLVSELADLRVV